MFLNDLLNRGRRPASVTGQPSRAKPNATLKPDERLPRTQDQVAVIAAHDNMLILRDCSVVGAVGLSSVDDALLAPFELQAKLTAYRDDLLKRLRFEFQLLIGTRPQNLDAYHRAFEQRLASLAQWESWLTSLKDRMEGYFACEHFDETSFRQHFGFAPNDLAGTPGMGHEAAWDLCNDAIRAKVATGNSPLRLREALDAFSADVESSLRMLTRWQDLIYERSAFVEATVQSIQAPVRTIYLATSYNPRLLTKTVVKGPITEAELQRAREELDRRCDQLARGIERMKLPAWRATHDELLDEIRYFYHPSQAQLARREIHLDRSVSMQLARAGGR